jgi:hypothetical protein
MFRAEKQDKDVYTNRYNTAQRNPCCGAGWFLADDSTLSVDRSSMGLVSSRLDVLSEMDVIWKSDYGFRVSGAGWYDPQYGSDSDHPDERRGTWGQPSVKPGEYTNSAEDWHYAGGELLDAFVFGNWDIGDTSLGVRAGRHTIYWGNSLLAVGAINGFGGSMAALDFGKGLSVPGSEAKELFLPSNKISAVWQVTDNVTLNAFWNLQHERNRVPQGGTYFAPITGLAEDDEFITLLNANTGGRPTDDDLEDGLRIGYKVDYGDRTEEDDFGFNVQYYFEPWALEMSFIYMNYVDKNLHGGHIAGDFVLLAQGLGLLPGDGPQPQDNWDSEALIGGSGFWIFPDDIDLYGVSFAKEIAGISFGLDIVYREDAGLAQSLAATLAQVYNVPTGFNELVEGFGFTPLLNPDGTNMTEEQFFARDSGSSTGPLGDTWSVVFNGVGLLRDNGFWEGGSYIFETTASMLDKCNENCGILDNRIKDEQVFWTVAGVFRPTWYQIWPGTDLTLPITFSYNFGDSEGDKSPFTFGGDGEGGSGSVGAEFLIDQVWTVRGAYNYRFGPVNAGIGGLLKDRDNISFTVKRTF